MSRSAGGPPLPNRADRIDRRIVGCLFAATLLAFTGIGSLLPVLPRYVTEVLDGDAVTVGVVMGSYTVSGLLVRPFAGRMSDRRGRRPVALLALGALAVSGSMLFAATSVALLICARLVLGIGQGSMNTTMNLWVIDATPRDRRGQMIGLVGVAIWGGLALGPVAGQYLLTHISYEAVWLLAVVAPLMGAGIVRLVPDHRQPGVAEVPAPWLPRAAVRPGVALLLTTLGWGTASGFVVLHLSSRGVAHGATVFTAYGLTIVAARVVAGRLPDVMGPRLAVMAGGTSQAVGLSLIAIAQSAPVAIWGGAVLGFGTSLVFPSLAVMVLTRADPSQHGAALGAFTSFFDAGVGLGAPFAGLIAATAGYEAAFWVAAASSLLGMLVAATWRMGATAAVTAP